MRAPELLSSCRSGRKRLPAGEGRLVMELRHLRYFVAVAEELSFRRAAHRLHVSHPALSQQVHDLENELGLKLFERNSRRVELTEIGRTFLIGVRRALAATKEEVKQALKHAKSARRRIVIGSIGPLTSSFLPVALARFRERRPLVEVTVLNMNNRAQVEAVLNGSIMLGIGSFDSAVTADEREQLCTRLNLMNPNAPDFRLLRSLAPDLSAHLSA